MTTGREGDSFKAACGGMVKKVTLSKGDKSDSIIWYRWISKSCSVPVKLAYHKPCWVDNWGGVCSVRVIITTSLLPVIQQPFYAPCLHGEVWTYGSTDTSSTP